MEHLIQGVHPGSVAIRRGLRAGDTLLSIGGEDIKDMIDYQALTARTRLSVKVRRADGTERTIDFLKSREVPLGLEFGESMNVTPRACRNHCVFCFIDQMPRGMRKTLYVKDDDWRLSLMMGNYITLTNVDDCEFERIIRRRASPLYISVHATNPDVRIRMMGNPHAGDIMPRLQRLCAANIAFHCQIVLCPGYNDGEILDETLRALSALYPHARSAALVPVGLTKYRDGLASITPFDKEKAERTLCQLAAWQERLLKTHGTRFVFAADELYSLAGRDMPEEKEYEGYPQIENGVGLVRRFEREFALAAGDDAARERLVTIACGESVAPYLQQMLAQYAPRGAHVSVRAVENRFFGGRVTVTGLLTGGDLIDQLKDCGDDEILICSDMLRSEQDLFLDDVSLEALNKALGGRVSVIANRGDALYQALIGK